MLWLSTESEWCTSALIGREECKLVKITIRNHTRQKDTGNRNVTTPLSLTVASYLPAVLFYLIDYLPQQILMLQMLLCIISCYHGNCVLTWMWGQILSWQNSSAFLFNFLDQYRQGSKLWPIWSPMRLTFSPWRLKFLFSRQFGDLNFVWFRSTIKY